MRILVADYAGHPFQSQLSREFAGRGHDVLHAFAGRVGGPKGNLGSGEDIPGQPRFRSLGQREQDKESAVSRVLAALDFGAALSAEIKDWQPDVVLAANTPPEGLIRAGLARPGIKWVWWVQDLFALASAGTLRKRSPFVGAVATTFYTWAERRLADSCHAVIPIAASFTEHLPAAARRKAHVVHNWAPIEELPVSERGNTWSVEHGLSGTFNFVYTGTLAIKHSPEVLVELARGLREHPHARVVLVSEGPGADFVESARRAEALDNLIILPFQAYELLPAVMASADVLLALLEADAGAVAVPSKVLSYLCAGRPVLASMPSANLATEILLSSKAGWVVPPGDGDAFARAGVKLMESEIEAEAMGQAGREFALENFKIELICDRFLSIMGVT